MLVVIFPAKFDEFRVVFFRGTAHGVTMNVTKKNFEDAANEIEKLLPSVDFVAIDEEMTGIALPGSEEKVIDLPAVRYEKMRKSRERNGWFHVVFVGV